MTAVLDKALSARSKCMFCGITIDRDAVRVVRKPSYAHLRCAIDHDRPLAREALTSPSTSPKLISEVISEVSALDPELADDARTGHRRIKLTRVAPKPLDDPRTVEMLRDIEADPDNRALYSVLGDHLQSLGDERGELIALDLTEPLGPSALIRRRELAGSLTPDFDNHAARFSWGIGFLRKIELAFVDGDLADYRAQFAHPSCRFLDVLHIGTNHRLRITIPPDVLPRSLRTLVVRGLLESRSDLSTLPNLQHLTLMDCEAPVVHPTLRSVGGVWLALRALQWLKPDHLPAVRRLSVDQSEDGLLVALEYVGWLGQITELTLSNVRLTTDDYEALERGLAGRKLARLSIDTRSPLERERLLELCDELVVPADAPSGALFVEHTGRPEWGRGRILRAFDGKLEIEFPSGRRTLKDGPYLRRVPAAT